MSQGRWPANVILDPAMADALDDQSGSRKSSTHNRGTMQRYDIGRDTKRPKVGTDAIRGHADSGGASRFFLTAWYEPEELKWIYEVGLRPYGQEDE